MQIRTALLQTCFRALLAATPLTGCLLAELVSRLPLFPGESDADQLHLILACFGRLGERQMGWLEAHPL
jgi:hypothetical protein